MRSRRRRFAAWLPVLLAWSTAGHAAEQQGFDVGMHLEIAADGSVTAVDVPEAVFPALRQGLVQRALFWRFTPATWRGQPVAVREWVSVELEPVPTDTGGYAIRILGRGHAQDPGTSMAAPRYPQDAMRAGATAELVYQVHVAKDGGTTPVALLEPHAVKGHVKALDAASRAAISAWHVRPFTANGQAVACEMRMPIEFSLDRIGGTDVRKPGPPLPDACPRAKLSTEIAGTML